MEPLATELLHEVKQQSKRWFTAFIIMLGLFFVTNIAWLIAWNLPTEKTTTTVTQSSEDDGVNNYADDRSIINDKADSKNNDN